MSVCTDSGGGTSTSVFFAASIRGPRAGAGSGSEATCWATARESEKRNTVDSVAERRILVVFMKSVKVASGLRGKATGGAEIVRFGPGKSTLAGDRFPEQLLATSGAFWTLVYV